MRPQMRSLGGGELLPPEDQEGAQEEGHLGWVPEGSGRGGRMGVVFTGNRVLCQGRPAKPRLALWGWGQFLVRRRH